MHPDAKVARCIRRGLIERTVEAPGRRGAEHREALAGAGGVLRIERRAGPRRLLGELRDLLREHQTATRGEPGDYVFAGSSRARPFSASAVYRRVRTA